MTGLLDTHGLVWWLMNDRRLSARVLEFVGDPATRILVSAATAWEVAIKVAQGRLISPPGAAEFRACTPAPSCSAADPTR